MSTTKLKKKKRRCWPFSPSLVLFNWPKTVIKLTRPQHQLSRDLIVKTDALICFSVISEGKGKMGHGNASRIKGESSIKRWWTSGLGVDRVPLCNWAEYSFKKKTSSLKKKKFLEGGLFKRISAASTVGKQPFNFKALRSHWMHVTCFPSYNKRAMSVFCEHFLHQHCSQLLFSSRCLQLRAY